ncbi:hypothetical protein SH528x_006974 [Novipirellula sp. SH528]|uniref:hypothetical protein n=1 Tax=Novipirellula sp. SH528 TaxID=3454466 RepID=UPI003F9FA286
MPLSDPMQVAAPAFVRQMSIVSPQTVSQRPLTQQASDLQSDEDVSEEVAKTHDQALEDWDQDETRTGEQTDKTDLSEDDKDSLVVSVDELAETGGVDAAESTHTDAELPLLPLVPSSNANHSNANNTSASASAMITLVIPSPTAGMPLFDSPTTSTTNDRGVYADHFHYFAPSASRTETSVASLASEPLSNHAARDSFMAMSMLKPSGIDNRVRVSATNAFTHRTSDSIPTTIVRTTLASQEPISQTNTQEVSQRKTVTPLRLGSLPMVTLLHSVIFAGQMVLDSSAEVINLNHPNDDGQSAGTELPSPPIAMTTADASKPESDSESPISYQNGLFLTVVCASLSFQHLAHKRTKLLQWTWLLVDNQRTE